MKPITPEALERLREVSNELRDICTAHNVPHVALWVAPVSVEEEGITVEGFGHASVPSGEETGALLMAGAQGGYVLARAAKEVTAAVHSWNTQVELEAAKASAEGGAS